MAAKDEASTLTKVQIQLVAQGKDISYMKKQLDDNTAKQDLIIEQISKLAFVRIDTFEEYKAERQQLTKAFDKRLSSVEAYIEENSGGINLANQLSKRLTQVFTFGLVAAGIIGALYYVIHLMTRGAL